MISYEKLVKKARVFKSITGLSIEEFEQLYLRFGAAWVEHERQRLGRPNRKRAIGGGRKYALKLKDQLVMVTCWLRLYLNTEAMGFFFGVDKSTVSRNCRRLLKVLRTLGDKTLGRPAPPQTGPRQEYRTGFARLSRPFGHRGYHRAAGPTSWRR